MQHNMLTHHFNITMMSPVYCRAAVHFSSFLQVGTGDEIVFSHMGKNSGNPEQACKNNVIHS